MLLQINRSIEDTVKWSRRNVWNKQQTHHSSISPWRPQKGYRFMCLKFVSKSTGL